MQAERSSIFRSLVIWGSLLAALLIPILLAAKSPLLEWRSPVYIISGLAGILAMALLLVQPLLAGNLLPGLSPVAARRYHRITGAALVLLVALHIGGLWITSPPDVIDVLLFRSPTPFSLWGAFAMWGVIFAALSALFRRRLKLRLKTWQRVHILLAVIIASCTVLHALLIEGTMETVSKIVLAVLVLLIIGRTVVVYYPKIR